MKKLGFVLALMLVMGGAYAATATLDLYPGWQTVSCPLVPFDPRPAGPSEYSAFPPAQQATGVFEPLDWDLALPTLVRWDSAGTPQGWVTYNYNFDDGLDPLFGNVLLGEGYMIDPGVSGFTQLTIDGVPNGVPDANGKTDMWISLPKAGFALIGNPYAETVAVDQMTGAPISFTDGQSLKDWVTASDELQPGGAWVAPTMGRYDSVQGRYVTVGIYWFGDEYDMLAGAGYFLEVKKDNLAMIIDAPATP
jgi:hypothetical protein